MYEDRLEKAWGIWMIYFIVFLIVDTTIIVIIITITVVETTEILGYYCYFCGRDWVCLKATVSKSALKDNCDWVLQLKSQWNIPCEQYGWFYSNE